MGSTISKDVGKSKSLSDESSSSVSGVSKNDALTKPIDSCTNTDLLILMQEYKVTDMEKMVELLKKDDSFDGTHFIKLAKVMSGNDEREIDNEKDYIKQRLANKYSLSQGLVNRFVEKVIVRKLEKDVKNSSNNIFTRIEGKIPISTVVDNSSGSNDGGEYLSSTTTQIAYDPNTEFEDCKLTEWEKEGIAVFKTKLEPYYLMLKEHGKKLENVGLTGLVNLDAQNMICKDRFLFKTFCVPIMRNQKRVNLGVDAIMNVKLIISDLGGNQVLRTVMSQFANQEFGILHTGLLIGEWKFDWYDNSIVSVKRDKNIGASSAIAVIDLGSLKDKTQISSAFVKISDIVCTYNAKNTYSQRGCNCQHFVSDLLDALSLSKPKGSSFDKYFKNLKKGDISRKFYFETDLVKLIQTAKEQSKYKDMKYIKFTSRKELDEFCHYIKELGYFELNKEKQILNY